MIVELGELIVNIAMNSFIATLFSMWQKDDMCRYIQRLVMANSILIIIMALLP